MVRAFLVVVVRDLTLQRSEHDMLHVVNRLNLYLIIFLYCHTWCFLFLYIRLSSIEDVSDN